MYALILSTLLSMEVVKISTLIIPVNNFDDWGLHKANCQLRMYYNTVIFCGDGYFAQINTVGLFSYTGNETMTASISNVFNQTIIDVAVTNQTSITFNDSIYIIGSKS